MKRILLRLFVLIGLLIFAVPGNATSLDLYNDSVSVGSGVTATSPWADSAKLTWNIAVLGKTGWVSYEYEWSAGSRLLDHIILEISGNATLDDFKDYPDGATEIGTYVYSPGINNMPGPLYGLKFGASDEETTVIRFLSKRLPMWGSFYVQGGHITTGGIDFINAYNTGFGETAFNNGNFIAVPGTQVPEVPVPAAVWLFGTGFLGLFGVRRKMSKA